MRTLTKTVNFNFVEKVLREALALDEDIKIEPNTRLIDLGVEPIDILDIYYRLGINFSNYISGERLNEKGKRVLCNVAEMKRREYDVDLDTVWHFEALAKLRTTNEFIKQLMVYDLVDIKNYEITH